MSRTGFLKIRGFSMINPASSLIPVVVPVYSVFLPADDDAGGSVDFKLIFIVALDCFSLVDPDAVILFQLHLCNFSVWNLG